MLYRNMGRTGDSVSILGYGCMRFPQKNGRIDEERTERQIVRAIEKGVNYFDTAYLYHNGKSESVLGKILKKGYREKVRIATKLPAYLVHSRAEMDQIFETQLRRLCTDYIDYYLMHSLPDKAAWDRLKRLGILEFLQKEKDSGRIRYIGFSYHGDLEDFKKIVDDYPWDFCQIQYNYLDENYQAGKAGLLYASGKGLGVVVMEPLRGGSLAGKVPDEVRELWNQADVQRTPAEWALRWIWNHPEVTTLLSGMNEEAHIDENVKIAGDAMPNSLTQKELMLVDRVKETYLRLMKVGCTGCRYCMPCPAGVDIPLCFSLYNSKTLFHDKKVRFFYLGFTSGAYSGKPSYASLCMSCGKCEKVCPQHLPIRNHLKQVAKEMEIPFMKLMIRLAKGALKLRSFFKTLGAKSG